MSAKKHAKLPFPAPVPPSSAAEAEEEAEEDIEVDLGLQQALIQSVAPSPAKIHTKGNALHDISNWRLPTPVKKQAAGPGEASPLQTLTGPQGDTHFRRWVLCGAPTTMVYMSGTWSQCVTSIACIFGSCFLNVPCLLAATPSKA